jgi:heme-degrading monooxygenase HmoA
MHARVSTYEGDVDRLIQGFERQADLVRGLEGFARAYLLVDRPGGRAVIVALWSSEDALDASASRAGHLRQEAIETAGATIGSVDNYEVAFELEGGGGG